METDELWLQLQSIGGMERVNEGMRLRCPSLGNNKTISVYFSVFHTSGGRANRIIDKQSCDLRYEQTRAGHLCHKHNTNWPQQTSKQSFGLRILYSSKKGRIFASHSLRIQQNLESTYFESSIIDHILEIVLLFEDVRPWKFRRVDSRSGLASDYSGEIGHLYRLIRS